MPYQTGKGIRYLISRKIEIKFSFLPKRIFFSAKYHFSFLFGIFVAVLLGSEFIVMKELTKRHVIGNQLKDKFPPNSTDSITINRMKELTKKQVMEVDQPHAPNDNDMVATPEDELLTYGSREGIRKSSKFFQVSSFI